MSSAMLSYQVLAEMNKSETTNLPTDLTVRERGVCDEGEADGRAGGWVATCAPALLVRS